MGAGEILPTAIDNDGKGQGFDLALVQSVSQAVTIPVIASSGAGSPQHFTEVRAHSLPSCAWRSLGCSCLVATLRHGSGIDSTDVAAARCCCSWQLQQMGSCRHCAGWRPGAACNFDACCGSVACVDNAKQTNQVRVSMPLDPPWRCVRPQMLLLYIWCCGGAGAHTAFRHSCHM